MLAWIKKHTAAAIAAGIISICVAATGIYSLVYGSHYKRENYSCNAVAVVEEDILLRYLNPQPNLLFLPSQQQAEQLEKGMTLRQAIACLGKPQSGSMEEGRLMMVWKLRRGEVQGCFYADTNRTESTLMGDYLYMESFAVE